MYIYYITYVLLSNKYIYITYNIYTNIYVVLFLYMYDIYVYKW